MHPRNLMLVAGLGAVVIGLALASVSPPGVRAASFVVNSADDTDDGVCDGAHCSLREAINAANAAAGLDTITFNIAPAGTHTIEPNSSGLGTLPAITDAVTIDATTQPGYIGAPLIELSGALAPNGTGLSITSNGGGFDPATIRGFVINRWRNGIAAFPTGFPANHVFIVLEHSYVGTDHSGEVDLGNETGVLGQIADLVLRNNLVSGNGIGVHAASVVFNGPINGVTAQGNIIGLNASGTFPLGNGTGMLLFDSYSLIGGNTPADRNIISGNGTGLAFTRTAQTGIFFNEVRGNYIGTDITGTTAIGNLHGISGTTRGVVVIGGAAGVTPGGPCTGECNVIAGNSVYGISMGARTDAGILGNHIGTDVTGALSLPNGDGVRLSANGLETTVHSVSDNIIAFNDGDGVVVSGPAGTATIAENSIHSNGGEGIKLVEGGNGDMAAPVITGTAPIGGTACADCTIHVYSDDEDEGRVYEGEVTAGPGGAWTFLSPVAGPCVTATATNGNGWTSEFSGAAAVSGATANNDEDFISHAPIYVVHDETLAHSDGNADECDLDDDNDGLPDTIETAGPPCATASAPTSPLALDSDGDRVHDGAECAMGSDPADSASRPALPMPADDPDGDRLSTAFELTLGTDPNDIDSDDDGLQDGWEFKGHGTDPLASNTDDDATTDGCEVASLNADTIVNVGDQALLAAEVMRGVPPSQKFASMDMNKDGAYNPGDQAFQASRAAPGVCT